MGQIDGYQYKSGTSQATAFVSGIAALIKSSSVNTDAESTKTVLINSSRFSEISSVKIANAYNSLEKDNISVTSGGAISLVDITSGGAIKILPTDPSDYGYKPVSGGAIEIEVLSRAFGLSEETLLSDHSPYEN
ncbi:hypothetical protein ADUPG1_002284, partial [Aduncisulcus paluster]